MSPASRGRKNKKSKTQRTTKNTSAGSRGGLSVVGGECDCPECTADRDGEEQLADVDAGQLIDGLLTEAGELYADDDPMSAEALGATFVASGIDAEGFEEVLVEGFIPEFEARGSASALAMLLAVGSVTQGRGEQAALAAADRLVKAGVTPPAWASELDAAITVDDCRRVADAAGAASILMCSFHRAGRSHSVVMTVDHLDCEAASDIALLDPADLPQATKAMRDSGRIHGVEIAEESIDPAELRWQFENALDARAVHDKDGVPGLDDTSDGELDSEYPALAVLLRSRLKALPKPSKPKARHGDGQKPDTPNPAEMLAQLLRDGPGPFGGRMQSEPTAKLPPKRKKSSGPAPQYQLKVGLRGAKPPIWRRLVLPADVSLARLHTIIQVAFDWDGGHLHVFDTPFGQFGQPDTDLGHRSEKPVTLEQVAPAVKSKISYTYDFGDDWEHHIVVEKILDPDPARSLRCTGGRRASPPEDCGGIWGYTELVEAVADPRHPEHEDMLEWLGLDEPSSFDPAAFDAASVTEALSRVR